MTDSRQRLPRRGLILGDELDGGPQSPEAQAVPEEARLCAAILRAGIEAARPEACLPLALRCAAVDTGIHLLATDVRDGSVVTAHVPHGGHAALLCIGKCAMGAALSLRHLLGPIISRSLVIDRAESWGWVPEGEDVCGAGPLELSPGSHPLPDERSLTAGRRARDYVASLLPEELLVVCLSGGASSLCEMPARGVPGEWLAKVPAALMHAGADIHALLAVRAAMSALKCGGLLERLPGGVALLVLVLSDVAGDDPADIGGAPFYPPATGRLQALLDDTLVRFGHVLPEGARDWLNTTGRRRLRPQHVQPAPHVVVMTNAVARQGALRHASEHGLVAEDLGELDGRPYEIAASLLTWAGASGAAQVAVMGGEAVAEVRGTGRGGPNLEVVAACIPACAAGAVAAVAALDTDGGDGSSDLAGAVLWPALAQDLQAAAPAALQTSDSDALFRDRGGLRWGATGANVSDLRVIFRVLS